jgi:hypothetical protein
MVKDVEGKSCFAALMYYPSNCLKGLRKTTMKNCTQGS